ncbi:MAG: prohibitin family protein [Candidatus Omnitrophica bacterium]|nr:prohibitin family protein [Candidatus Omnitrophota bacterium]
MRNLLLFFMALSLTGCAVKGVEDGQKGVEADFGKIQNEALGTGWHWFNPITSWIEVWNVKTQNLEETSNVPSSEGLVSNLDVSILYHVPPDKVVFVRKTIGTDYQGTVLEPYMREAIRNVASGYPVSDLYSETGRKEIAAKILQYLKGKLDARGIVVEDVLIKGVQLPMIFSASIENKLKTEQESLQKQYELQKAKMDAQIEIAKAEGVAKSNKIIADSISENYLRYKFIENLHSTSKEVVYVPTEANLPILEATRNVK